MIYYMYMSITKIGGRGSFLRYNSETALYVHMDRLEQQISFIMEIDKIKKINRQTYLADNSRPENDAEHSWHLAAMCFLLKEYANEEFDVLRTMEMVLMHDVIEIDAGDTYAYDTEGNKSKRERELKAAERIFNLLPKDQANYVRKLWDEFEDGETPEARFANALDKIQPLLLNDASGGDSWKKHGVHIGQILKRNERTPKGSETLWEYCKPILDKNINKGNIIDEIESKGNPE